MKYFLQPPTGSVVVEITGTGRSGMGSRSIGIVSMGSRLMQVIAAPAKPASLPPIPTVTRSVVGVSRSYCGGLVPPNGSDCGPANCLVVAEPQVASRITVTPSARATSFG